MWIIWVDINPVRKIPKRLCWIKPYQIPANRIPGTRDSGVWESTSVGSWDQMDSNQKCLPDVSLISLWSEMQSGVFKRDFSMSSQRHANCTDRSQECSNKQSVVTGDYCQNWVYTLPIKDKISQLLVWAVSSMCQWSYHCGESFAQC